MNTYTQLSEVFRQVFDDNTIQLTAETTSNDIEGWDSLSHVNLMIAVELKFEIEFSQREVANFANVGELVECIEKHLAEKA